MPASSQGWPPQYSFWWDWFHTKVSRMPPANEELQVGSMVTGKRRAESLTHSGAAMATSTVAVPASWEISVMVTGVVVFDGSAGKAAS